MRTVRLLPHPSAWSQRQKGLHGPGGASEEVEEGVPLLVHEGVPDHQHPADAQPRHCAVEDVAIRGSVKKFLSVCNLLGNFWELVRNFLEVLFLEKSKLAIF